MIEIKPAAELGKNAKRKLSEIFVDGFGMYLTFFSKDKEKLVNAFEHMFVTEVFYVAVIDGEAAGMAACTDSKARFSINHDKKELIKHLGLLKGTFADYAFKREFQKPPVLSGEKTASVEFVATASKYRGKGAASAIMKHLFSLPQYEEYVLEVADTNTNAVRLYEKLGYKEFRRIRQRFGRISGVNYLVYMKYDKQPESGVCPAYCE